MKRLISRVLPLVAGAALGAGLLLSGIYATGGGLVDNLPGISRPPDGGDPTRNSSLVARAYDILDTLKNSDYESLARSVHPEYGVIFAPYATISLPSNKRFTEGQVSSFGVDANTYVWGVYDGSGEPIELSPAAYFARFVYNKDFARAPVVGVNYTVRSGNALENVTDVFPDAQYVDFYFPGDDKGADSRDWNSLRLGFEDYSGTLCLTVIIHSEWTA
ncbi:MAG: hypothetical protein LBC21_02605 [Oscillospiraceae bacterium]|jgi:hypothetical protein|nr:hypothetical protein [Oscillospiraceae bacterium]